MDTRAAELISSLELVRHPEGGYFREIYRSPSHVQPHDERSRRTALTTIYFLLTTGDVSRWHRVASDEVWHYYEGDALELVTARPGFERITRHVIGCFGERTRPVHVVGSNEWQAARSTGAYTLVGCTVGPGFEFADFQMLRDLPVEAQNMQRQHPDMVDFV